MRLDQKTTLELRTLLLGIRRELYERTPPKVTPEVQAILDDLKVIPVMDVAEKHGRSKQFLYRECNRHFIAPIKRKKADP